MVAERCGLPHSFTIRAVELQLRGKSRPCFIYLFVFVVSRTFQPNIATCDRFFSLTHQETECLFNTSRCTFFLVVSIKNSGFAENKHTTSLLWDCVSVLSSAVFACGNGLVFFQLNRHLPANLNIIRGHYWRISRQTEWKEHTVTQLHFYNHV